MSDPSAKPLAAPQPVASAHKPHLRVHTGMSFRDAGREVMAFHFRRMIENERGTIEGIEPEPLHDMRVATRRLRAAFRVFRDPFGKETVSGFSEEARWIAGLLGKVRDLDVFLEWLREHEQQTPEALRHYVGEVTHEREAARTKERAELVAALNSERYAQFKRVFPRFLQRSAAAGELEPSPAFGKAEPASFGALRLVEEAIPLTAHPPEEQIEPRPAGVEESPVVDPAVCAIRRQLKRVQKIGKKADEDDLDRLHDLRIAVKRLRYACEFFRDVLPDRAGELIRLCVDIQDGLGAMRDAHIQAEFLRPRFREYYLDVPRRMALLRVARALRRRQRGQYRTFARAWRKFTSKKFQRRIKKWLRESRHESSAPQAPPST